MCCSSLSTKSASFVAEAAVTKQRVQMESTLPSGMKRWANFRCSEERIASPSKTEIGLDDGLTIARAVGRCKWLFMNFSDLLPKQAEAATPCLGNRLARHSSSGVSNRPRWRIVSQVKNSLIGSSAPTALLSQKPRHCRVGSAVRASRLRTCNVSNVEQPALPSMRIVPP
jgi:hypothetical protein